MNDEEARKVLHFTVEASQKRIKELEAQVAELTIQNQNLINNIEVYEDKNL